MRFKLIHIAETDSTNRYCSALASQSPTEEALVWTDFQTAGRGCGTNTWESERGKNLLFSVLFRPRSVQADRQFMLSEAVAWSLYRVVAARLGADGVSIKWPNDLYVGDKKLAGILIENQLRGTQIASCIAGVGLNVNQRAFLSDAPNPVSLSMLTGVELDREALLRQIAEETGFQLNLLDQQADYGQRLHADYCAHLYRRTGQHAYSDGQGEFRARLVTVEPDGHLVLRDGDNRLRRYAFKEVRHVI